MGRPITLFTGQWADLSFDEVCRYASKWGYDGLEIACWGDHFEVDKALADKEYIEKKKRMLEKYNLKCWAISNHLVGQAVCDHLIDDRHQRILPVRIWGDGKPEGVRQRAAKEMMDTARAAKAFGVSTVVGFTGSSIWHTIAMFPPVQQEVIDQGYQDFADRWNPILDVFDEQGVRFAHEVHPSEIAYDYWTTARTLEAIKRRPASVSILTQVTSYGKILTSRDSFGTSKIAYITWTARICANSSTGAAVASAPTCRGGIHAVGGISYPLVMGMCRGRTYSDRSTP
jgi:sugar phosphate isomerase/epimerase